jgi:pimeloyl-ACP methyl ester carboxylesterase
MPNAKVNGINLYYEEAGSGLPLVFVHEFADDYRGWEDQMRFFSRRYRCVTYSGRGYLPSEVPEDPKQYSQDQSLEDLKGLLDHLGVKKAHLCGCSMGANGTLYFGLKYPERCLSLTICGGGYGAGGNRAEFHKMVDERSAAFLKDGTAKVGESYTMGPARVQFYNKDRVGWQSFAKRFNEHSAKGSAYTMMGVQRQRPDILTLGEQMKKNDLPALIVLGDEDIPGLEGSLFIKKCMLRAGMAMIPKTGHAVNLEEPALFNQLLLDFLTAVDSGKWPRRDPKAMTALM